MPDTPRPPNPDRPIYPPPGGPPDAGTLSREIYGIMGEAAIFAMLDEFYQRLGRSEIAHLFPRGEDALRHASEKSGAFFSFLLGGPALYQQRYGRPMMRARHLPFRIDENARRVWLREFFGVLENAPQKHGFPAQHLPGFMDFLDRFSGWMVNTADEEPNETTQGDPGDPGDPDGGLPLPLTGR